jgi:23S rRNA (adenine2503-C2)-methyltransferase
MDLDLLERTLTERDEPAFRARQVWRWASQGAPGYRAMTNLPAALRETLAEQVPHSTLTVQSESRSRDGTVKTLFSTADGRPLEAVLMRYHDGRSSLCLSSQSGCPLTCTFCATGQMRFGRNLTAWEIVDQALHFRRLTTEAGEPGPDHAVFMGMGEPMMNLDAVLAACSRLPDIGITARRTAISTVGWIPGIERLTADPRPIRLALSLHAADPALRSQLMPVNDRYPLDDVLAACHAHHERKRRKVFVEYVMLAGVNDSVAQAIELAERLGAGGHQIYKVNLIPFNPTGSAYAASTRRAIAAFGDQLERRGLGVTVRLTRGQDIEAACGQLAAAAS